MNAHIDGKKKNHLQGVLFRGSVLKKKIFVNILYTFVSFHELIFEKRVSLYIKW